MVAVDVDHSAEGKHAPLTQELHAQLEEALARAPGSLAHLTPRGLRVVFLLSEELTDESAWKATAEGAGRRVTAWLAAEGVEDALAVDEPALTDTKRFLWTPRATVDGKARDAAVRILRAAPYPAASLRPRPAPPASTKAPAPPAAPPPPALPASPLAGPAAPGDGYGARALAEELAAVRTAPEGTRNAQLNKSALKLARLVAAGELAEEPTRAALLAAALEAGLPQAEAEATIRSGFAKGLKEPRQRGPRRVDAPPAQAPRHAEQRPARGEDPPAAPSATPGPTKPAAPRRGKAAPPAPLVPAEATARPERPTIQLVPGQLHVVNEQGALALASDPALYRRDMRPVAVFNATSEQQEAEERSSGVRLPAGAPVIAEVSAPLLCDRLSRAADWERLDTRRGIFQPCDVPERNARAIHARLDWPQLRPLVGVTQVPVLRPDGSLFSSPGYDRQTGLFYWPAGPVDAVPEQPTREDALKARDALLEVVVDFPFDHPAGPAAWLAGLLSAVGFGAYGHLSGAPMFAFSASVAASGKTTLADAIANLLTGADMPRIAYAEDDAEMRKSIFGLCRSGNSLALIDNVPNGSSVGWPSLDAALTGRTLEGRILGTSETQRVDHRIVWYLTGNNFSLASDTTRRTILARLEPQTATPEEREGFRHPDLLGWVRAERPRLLAAALTLLRGYVVAGRPSQKLRPIGSFKAWSDLIREAIVWAGFPDPCELLASRSPDADPTAAAHARLLLAWDAADVKGEGLAIAEVLRRLHDLPELAEALSELVPTRDGSPPASSRLGLFLNSLKGRRRDVGEGVELAFQKVLLRTRAGTVRWLVKKEAKGNRRTVHPTAGGAGGTGGISQPTRARCQFEDKALSDNSTGLVAQDPLYPLHSPASARSVDAPRLSLAGPSETLPLPPNAGLAPPPSGPVAQGADEERVQVVL